MVITKICDMDKRQKKNTCDSYQSKFI